jgi:hypothetical protein
VDLIKEIIQSPGLLKEIYGDLAKPGVSQVGKALSTVVGLGNTILWPVALLNEKAKISLENNLNKYRERLKDIPEENITEVPPEVGVPIAEKLAYVSNEELSDMYVELLAKASSIDLASQAHPSFVNAINNFSPDEAILLNAIKLAGDIPFVDVRLTIKGKNEWASLNPLLFNIKNTDKSLTFPQNLSAYISNFEGLGILHVRTDIFIVGNNLYEPLEELAKSLYQSLTDTMPDRELTFERGKIEITPFGRMLIAACTPVKKA